MGDQMAGNNFQDFSMIGIDFDLICFIVVWFCRTYGVIFAISMCKIYLGSYRCLTTGFPA
jgi:hypothetical protein